MYNPSDVGKKGSLFGFPYTPDQAELLILPVGFDVTTSYGDGTASSPNLILDESSQLDLSIPGIKSPWNYPVALDSRIAIKENSRYREKAKAIIDKLEAGESQKNLESELVEVNSFCTDVHSNVEKVCLEIIDSGKKVGILGGDHSSPLGLIKALAKDEEFGILQIDAHLDLRNAYEGFNYSHASIMYNALQEKNVSSLTSVGIRDYCEEEGEFIQDCTKPIHVFYDEPMEVERMYGSSWINQVDHMIETLPNNVYVSFDIDGLDPSLCPNTGTPVPGGLSYNQAMILLTAVVKSGRRIVGFDLCEVGNATWDASVGSRVLFRLAALTGISSGYLKWGG